MNGLFVLSKIHVVFIIYSCLSDGSVFIHFVLFILSANANEFVESLHQLYISLGVTQNLLIHV